MNNGPGDTALTRSERRAPGWNQFQLMDILKELKFPGTPASINYSYSASMGVFSNLD